MSKQAAEAGCEEARFRCDVSSPVKLHLTAEAQRELANEPDQFCSPKSSRGVRTTPAFLCRPQTPNGFSKVQTVKSTRNHLKRNYWPGFQNRGGFTPFIQLWFELCLWTWCDHVSSSVPLETNALVMRLKQTVSLLLKMMMMVLLDFTDGEFTSSHESVINPLRNSWCMKSNSSYFIFAGSFPLWRLETAPNPK